MAKHRCVECDKDIDGETVWYRPYAEVKKKNYRTWQFVSTVSRVQSSDKERPLHPECFTKQTGQEWPPSMEPTTG